MSSSVKGRLPMKVVFHQRLLSVKGRLPSKVIFSQRSFSVKGRLPADVVFHRVAPQLRLSCPRAAPELPLKWIKQLWAWSFRQFWKLTTHQPTDPLTPTTLFIEALRTLKIKVWRLCDTWPSIIFKVSHRHRHVSLLVFCASFGTCGRHCSWSPLDGRLAMTLVDRYFHHYFPFHFLLRCDLFS